MYLGELAPKNLRGALGVVPQLFITVGILVAQLFGLRSVLATEEGKKRGPSPPPQSSPPKTPTTITGSFRPLTSLFSQSTGDCSFPCAIPELNKPVVTSSF